MDATGYLNWLRTTELRNIELLDCATAVHSIVEALHGELGDDAPDPTSTDEEAHRELLAQMADALYVIQDRLDNGEIPLPELETFRQEFWADPQKYEPAEVLLDRELREIAGGIARARWSTELYQLLERSVEELLDGGSEDAFWKSVDEIDQVLSAASEGYAKTEILPKEVTMESTIVHRLLCEGIQLWQSAVEKVRDEETDEEPEWPAILKTAETGNRLLVAVQIYNERLQRALSL